MITNLMVPPAPPLPPSSAPRIVTRNIYRTDPTFKSEFYHFGERLDEYGHRLDHLEKSGVGQVTVEQIYEAIHRDPAKAQQIAQMLAPYLSQGSSISQEMVDRLGRNERDIRAVGNRANELTTRVGDVQTRLSNLETDHQEVRKLAVVTAAGVIPKVSKKGGENSPRCQIYRQLVAMDKVAVKGKAPKGCPVDGPDE